MYTQTIINKSNRNSSIELLRIISMILIIGHHFAVHGGFGWGDGYFTIPHIWWNFLDMGGKLGVNLFVLISGYFLSSSSKGLNLRRILKLWGEIVFYSIAIEVAYLIIKYPAHIGFGTVLGMFTPITYGCMWWFATTYFLLFCCILL